MEAVLLDVELTLCSSAALVIGLGKSSRFIERADELITSSGSARLTWGFLEGREADPSNTS